MKLYILKYNYIYKVCNCNKNIIIPSNDFQAIKLYDNLKYLYNKIFIAESQKIKCGIEIPINYPVIVRPITNLYGMGKDAYFLYNINTIPKDFFWCEIFKGNHISVDIFYNDNGILGCIAFQGFPGKLFTFDYWEYLPNYKLSNKIINWINNNLNSFKGVFNIELINDNIIECHLRMGDLNYFQNKELINCVIDCYKNKKINLPILQKIYLLPIFREKGKYIRLKQEDIYYFARVTNTKEYIINYFIDPPPSKVGNPNGGDRICNFTITNLEKGFILRKYILDYYNNTGSISSFPLSDLSL